MSEALALRVYLFVSMYQSMNGCDIVHQSGHILYSYLSITTIVDVGCSFHTNSSILERSSIEQARIEMVKDFHVLS